MEDFLPFFLAGALAYFFLRRRLGFKKKVLLPEMSESGKFYLENNIKFYQKLDNHERVEFENRVIEFINTTEITGYGGTEVTFTDQLLVGISAIIPIFKFKKWKYDFLHEVILYPKAIKGDGVYEGSYVNGLVGNGPMEGRMILAKDALYHAYSNNTDRKNVGIHEFAHIIDKQDGVIDGVPSVLLDEVQIGPWLELIRTKSKEIENKNAKINDYALTNDAEFFAVVTEYFFEHPEMMVKKHPELYETLEQIYA